MKLRQFVSIMGVVALVALIYSPSSIGFSASGVGDGGTGPTDTSQSGTSMFYTYLRGAGYHVTVANSSQQVVAGQHPGALRCPALHRSNGGTRHLDVAHDRWEGCRARSFTGIQSEDERDAAACRRA